MTQALRSTAPQSNGDYPGPLWGKVLDADGHLYVLPEIAKEIIEPLKSPVAMPFYEEQIKTQEYKDTRAKNRTPEGLWEIKGMPALGSYDPAERVEAIQAMGLEAQLLFPNIGAGNIRIDSDIARQVCSRYNDYAIEVTTKTRDLARGVCELNMTQPEWSIKELERILKKGAKAVSMPCHRSPGGVSPAHEIWDPVWAMLEEANVPALLHLGGAGLLHNRTPEDLMFPDPTWGEAKTLRNKPAMRSGGEEAISPYFMLVTHMAPELWIQTMVMGKVFERFPRLRFGIIELSAAWVGPMAERMDMWAEFMNKVGVKYDMKPSEYLRRNVRVTPFWHENLTQIIDRYGLEEMWVFSTDYPHLEGSKDPYGKFGKWLKKLKPGYEKAFLVDNSKWLFGA